MVSLGEHDTSRISLRVRGILQRTGVDNMHGRELSRARATFHNGVAEPGAPKDERALAVPASERHDSFVYVY